MYGLVKQRQCSWCMGEIKTAKAQHQCWNPFAAYNLWTLNRHFIMFNVSSRSINQCPFPRLVMNSHIYLTYIKQRWRQNKFYGSSSRNLICSRNAERKPLNIAIKLEAPSGDCYNDVTIETDPGVFLTLGGATICRGSELQPSVQDGIPNDHIHYSVWDYCICIHFFPFSRPFFPISHSNNMHKQILVYSAFIYFKVSLNL